MKISAFQYQEMLAKLGKPVDKSEWFMTPQTVNAYYNPSNNEIVFSAGILTPPFFNTQADYAINYGGIMLVLGNELSNDIDHQGSQLDGDGELNKWWMAENTANFHKLTQYMSDQKYGTEELD